jgi:hypothetical protein
MTHRHDDPPADKTLTGGETAEIEADGRCYLCGTDVELSYCTFCGKYFCAACERNYPARVIAATMEGFTALRALLSSVRPPEPAVPPNALSPQDRLCCGKRPGKG